MKRFFVLLLTLIISPMLFGQELDDFHNVVLPGKSHMTAIAVGGPMPQLYINALSRFINSNDE